jgi:predicted hydrolase (HD superfamily)
MLSSYTENKTEGKVKTMGRLKDLRKHVDTALNEMDDADKRNSAIAHLYGVSLAATMIAKKRGLDPELSSMAAMLHDLYAYKSGSYDDHAHKGAELARQILDELGLTTPDETDTICSAIYHHDDKLVIDSPMDEVLKDADVLHHCMNDLSKQVKDKEKVRFDKLCDEFGMK